MKLSAFQLINVQPEDPYVYSMAGGWVGVYLDTVGPGRWCGVVCSRCLAWVPYP